MPFVVESVVKDQIGGRQGVARVYVATESRAKEIVAQLPSDRTYREIALDDMPEKARANMISVHAPQ